jgi:hypothetical protein
MIKFFFAAVLFLITMQDFAVEMIINEPGIYRLSGALAISPNSSDTLITVLSSDVILDLNSYRIEQLNTTAGVNGILVSAGLTNIEIKDGIIARFTQSGLTVNEGCQIISVTSIIFERCTTSAVLFLGTGLNVIEGVEIVDCEFASCSQGAGAAAAISLNNCDQIMVKNISIYGTNNPNNLTLSMFAASDCQRLIVEQIAIFNNTLASGFLRGVLINNIIGSNFSGVMVERNSTTSGSFEGVRFFDHSATMLSDCQIVENRASQNIIGFVCDSCIDDLYKKLHIIANQAGAVMTAVRVVGPLGQSVGETFIDCVVSGNTGVTECQGFSVAESTEGIMQRCIITNNTANVVSSIGLFFSTVSTSSWTVADCVFDSNTGPASFGVLDTGGVASANFYTKNIGFNNGAVAANQFGNVPPGSQSTSTAANLNTTTLPWTNLAVVS